MNCTRARPFPPNLFIFLGAHFIYVRMHVGFCGYNFLARSSAVTAAGGASGSVDEW